MPAPPIHLDAYLTQIQNQLSVRTLCLLQQGNQVLLGRRKGAFGKGKYSGIGGKVEAGETVPQAAVRETVEEIGVEPLAIEPVATLTFLFPQMDEPENWNQQVHVFTGHTWRGTPTESAEMAPAWFTPEQIPYDRMWADAPLWLPRVLAGEKLKGYFIFDRDSALYQHRLMTGNCSQ
ncbi:MAG: NUDIX domain-containing protein [Candidatus Latescibacteria bacterium]|nr:NUDIX domain-containing protein [Candidatus Latescibacterota bacterium]